MIQKKYNKFIYSPAPKIKRKTFCKNKVRSGVASSVNDPAIIYDFEGGLYPAAKMDLAVLVNSD